MYDNRWLCFAHWGAGQGIDTVGPTASQIAAFPYYLFDTHSLSSQAIKGYRYCLASVLIRTGKAAAIQAKTISDMITCMELQRPKITPVLPQLDIGIALDALSRYTFSSNQKGQELLFILATGSCERIRDLIK